MKQPLAYAVGLGTALVAGGIFYSTIGISGWLITLIQWTVAAAAAVMTYMLWGLGQRHLKTRHPATSVLLMITRVVIAGYIGLLTNALMHNARFSTLYDDVASVLFAAGLGATFMTAIRRYYRQHPTV